MRSRLVPLLAMLSLAVTACGKDTPKRNPFDPSPSATKAAPKVSAVPKPAGPPEIQVDQFGPKVGFEVVLIEKKDGRERLQKAIAGVKEHYEGKDIEIKVDRTAKTPWVRMVFAELEAIDVSSITVRTDTRPEFSPKLKFTPQGKAVDVPSCSLAMMVLDDRATATWKIAGGTAGRRSKGFAGPDLSTTAETIETRWKGCKDSSTYFVSADDVIEWGLTYDLAASAQKIPGVKLDRVVLLKETPVAGRPVKLK